MKMFKVTLLVFVILSSVPSGSLAQRGSELRYRNGRTEVPQWLQGQNQFPQKVPNIGYLGTSYNIFKGNPHSTHELDPGFTVQQVFALSYDHAETTPDGRYSIPDHTNVKDASVCNFDFHSQSVHDIASYFLSLKTDVDASFGAYGASFSASDDYQMVLKNTISQESRYVKSQAFCEDYIAVLMPGAKLTDSFKTAVEDLDDSDLDGYLRFIRQYGTHYLATVTMGGRYGFQSEFKTSEYMNMLSIGLDISAAAGYSGEIDINANTSTQVKIEFANEFNSHREMYRIYQVGGKPPSEPNGTAVAWAQTVKNDPFPIRYQLVEIAELFTKSNFDHYNIEVIQSKLKNATDYYCQRDLSLSFCDSGGPNSEGSIRIMPSTDVRQIELLKIPWFYQTVDSPSFAVMGMFFAQLSPNQTINGSYAIVDASNSAGNLITTAEAWQVVDSNFLRPICSENFSRISDFVCQDGCTCDESAECLNFLPKILPCVANQCLAQCSPTYAESFPLLYSVYYITNGFKVFGNGNSEDNLHFFTIQNGTGNSLFKCLSSVCIDDF